MKQQHFCTQQSKIDRLEAALFGDEFTKEKGIKEKVDDMHSLLVGTSMVKKFVIWIFSTSIAIGGAIVLWFELTKNIKQK